MVNIKIRFPYNVNGRRFCDSLCEALRGNPAFKNNDIMVCDPDEENKCLVVSLGDDTDINPRVTDITVKLEEWNEH